MTAPESLVVVAGTATEVGKTWVSAHLIELLRSQGLSVAARKPAQSFEPDDAPEGTDAGLLAAASGEDPHTVCPTHRWYPTAMAPPMAADALGRCRLHLAELVGELDASWNGAPVDIGLVELAGGPWSPMTHDGDGIALTRLLHPDHIVLVADAGLGTLNAVRPAAAVLGEIAPVSVFLNRFDPADDLHRRNCDWLDAHDGLRPTTSITDLAATLQP